MMGLITLMLSIAATVTAIVGGVTAVHYARKDRTTLLRVRPGWWFVYGDPAEQGIQIDVLNLSAFPVTITNVGYLVRGRKGFLTWKPAILDPAFGLPLRLEPHDSHAFRFPNQFLEEFDFSQVTKAIVYTSSGEYRCGTNHCLKEVIANARSKKRSRNTDDKSPN
jgi:hypothetical protein